MKKISYNSRILRPQEQKLSTLDRELPGIVHAIQYYEFRVIGSPHLIQSFTYHNPLLLSLTKKGNLSPQFYRAQMQLTKFSKRKIIHTPGNNFLLPLYSVDLLQKLNSNLKHLNINIDLHKLIFLSYKKLLLNLYITYSNTKKFYVIRNMTLIISLLIMVQINCRYVLMTKVMMLLLSL